MGKPESPREGSTWKSQSERSDLRRIFQSSAVTEETKSCGRAQHIQEGSVPPASRATNTHNNTVRDTCTHTHTHMCCICLLGGLHHLNNLNHTFQCNLNGCCTGACSVCRTRFLSKSPKFFVFLFVYKVLPWQWPIHPSIFCYPHLPNQAQGGSGTHPDGAFLGSRYKISHRKLLTEPICLDLFLRAGMQPTLLKPRCVWGQQCQRELC